MQSPYDQNTCDRRYGFVGRAITRQLVAQHETVQVLSRNPLAVPPEQRVPGALYVKGDILDPQSVAAAMQDCDAIVHCVQFPGAPFENPSKGWTYNNIDGRGTEILCEAAQKQNISRLLYKVALAQDKDASSLGFKPKIALKKPLSQRDSNGPFCGLHGFMGPMIDLSIEWLTVRGFRFFSYHW
ncbi:MAG: NAD(P)H-binding protein [Bdellovibrionota bacterium]